VPGCGELLFHNFENQRAAAPTFDPAPALVKDLARAENRPRILDDYLADDLFDLFASQSGAGADDHICAFDP